MNLDPNQQLNTVLQQWNLAHPITEPSAQVASTSNLEYGAQNLLHNIRNKILKNPEIRQSYETFHTITSGTPGKMMSYKVNRTLQTLQLTNYKWGLDLTKLSTKPREQSSDLWHLKIYNCNKHITVRIQNMDVSGFQMVWTDPQNVRFSDLHCN